MSLLASDIASDARALLNDSQSNLYTNTALLPFLQMASRDTEKKLIINGYFGVKMQSSAISVAANSTTLTLPADFLLPIRLFERPQSGTDADWIPMYEDDWNPENDVSTTTIGFWSFRNLAINLRKCINNREVLLEYERILPVITSASSPIENTTIVQAYMAALTAEYAAGQLGMSDSIATAIHNRFTMKAEDDMERMLVLNQQGLRFRRRRFTTKTIANSNMG